MRWDHCGQSLLGHAARLKETREVAARPELGDTQLDGSGPRLPIALTITITLRKPQRVLLTIASTRLGADLKLHQLLGRKADHLTQQISISALLNERAHVHHVVGHQWSFHQVGLEQPDPTGKTLMTARYAAHSLQRD